jgi:ABC-type nitrate/sulfonate/bicarbonate transport system substrate-binding protein
MRTLSCPKRLAVAAFALAVGVCQSALAQQKVIDMKTCWQPEHSTFIMWNAKEKGWDKKAGINTELVYFDSGMAQIEALPAKQWVTGGTGGVPMLVGALRYGAYLIGIANDDSTSNVVMVRPNSPILKSKGAVPGFPETYGTADAVRGKTILVTTVSSGHFALSTWLKRLGLKDTDVVIKNMDQGQMLAAFESGIGDVAVLWAPGMYTGIAKGWKVVNQDSQKGANQLNVLIADKKFADENPEQVAKFLKVYMQGIDYMKAEDVKLAANYVKFLNDWAGVKITRENAIADIKQRKIYDLKEQLKLFDASKGPSEVETWIAGAANFFVEQGKFKKEEMDKVMKSGFVTDKFLKMAAEMK